MLVLYSKETTSFSSLGIGVLRDFIDNPIITEEINGAYTLEFKYAKDGYLNESLVEQNIIKANGQPFRIWNVKKDMSSITILAKHIFFDLTFNFLNNVAPTNLNAQNALSWILARTTTTNSFTVTGDCTALASARYVRKNTTDAIFNDDNALVERFGCELSYNNYAIYCHQKRGTNTNFSIRYKKNLTGIDFNLDFSNVATRIIPIGFDGLMIDNVYVESTKVGNYFTPLYKTYEFSDIKYDPDNSEAYQTEAAAKAALTAAANALFTQGVDEPSVSIKIDFVELSKCEEYKNYSNLEFVHLGDTIKAVIPDLNLNIDTRVVKTTYDCLKERFTKLELGSTSPSSVKTQIQVNNELKSTASFINDAQENAKSLINHPFKGNIYIDRENGEFYLMDSKTVGDAVQIWKWSLGGLGFSSTGINGSFTTAITQDGSINADFITTGAIATERIEGLDSLIIRINSNIDDDGNITAVKTTNGYQFDNDGLKIYKNETSFNTLINNEGSYYKDGETILTQTTKDGTITKDLVLYGKYYYGVSENVVVSDFKRSDAMFLAELYTITTTNGTENGMGHFYNGDD